MDPTSGLYALLLPLLALLGTVVELIAAGLCGWFARRDPPAAVALVLAFLIPIVGMVAHWVVFGLFARSGSVSDIQQLSIALSVLAMVLRFLSAAALVFAVYRLARQPPTTKRESAFQ